MSIKIRNELPIIALLVLLLFPIIVFAPSNILRILLGLLFLLFFPGYCLVAALFPRRDDLGAVERLALSVGSSLAVVPLMSLLLNYTPWGIRLYPSLISVGFFIMATSIIAWYRRTKLSEEERFVAEVTLPKGGKSLLDKLLSGFVLVSIVATVGTMGYMILFPKIAERLTEFYIIVPSGVASGYPWQVVAGTEAQVTVGIVNREFQRQDYRVEARIDGELTQVTIDNQQMDEIPVSLDFADKWEQTVTFIPSKAGDNQKVEFVLYKGDAKEPYRIDYFWMNVT